MTLRTLITAEELASLLGDARLRIFDCRFDLARPAYGRAAYLDEHIPGAAYADLNADLSGPVTATSGRHPLPEVAQFETWLRARGVNMDSRIVAYDDNNGMYAARLWWMLRWLGHDEVAVLEGGMRRWLQLGLPLAEDSPAFESGNFIARPGASRIAAAAEVLAILREPGTRLLDARAPERYRGEVEPIDKVAGHVPGAVNHPFGMSLDSQGQFLAPRELRTALLASLDGTPAQQAITYCGSGVSACHLLLAFEHAGLPAPRLYPGSWSEWSNDPARPVSTGAAPWGAAT